MFFSSRRMRRSFQFESLETREVLSAASLTTLPLSSDAIQPVIAAVGADVAAAQMPDDAGHVTGHGDHDPGSMPVTSVRAGLWSDPATWGGMLPTSHTDVVLKHNVTLDHAVARQVTVEAGATATLTGEVHLHGSLLVRGMVTGARGLISFHVADDRLFTGNTMPGHSGEHVDFHPEDTGLWVLSGGRLELHGPEVTSWVNALPLTVASPVEYGVLGAEAFLNERFLLAARPVGWQVGDTLLLVNEKGDSVLAELRGFKGNYIHFVSMPGTPSVSDFRGKVLIAEDGTKIHPKVANLSRRLEIISGDVREGDTNHRAHIAILPGGVANMQNVELRDLGPRAIIGRYPIHFHHLGASSGGITGSSIWQDVSEPGNRFVAVHNSQGLDISNNVAFRSQGHGFFFEDGREYNNRLVGNLSVGVEVQEELTFAQSNVSPKGHHFWVRSGNEIADNVAAGGTALGFILLDSAKPVDRPQVLRQEVLGGGQYGIWSGRPNVDYVNPRVAFADDAGFSVNPAWAVDVSGNEIKNPIFLLNGRGGGGTYDSQVFLNNAKDIKITGGVIAGGKGLHAHYNSTFDIRGTRFNVGSLMTPTYFEFVGTIAFSTIKAQRMFDNPYPFRNASPGILQLARVNLAVTGEVPLSAHTGYYVGKSYANLYKLPSVDVGNGRAVRLTSTPAATGFLSFNSPGATSFKIRRSDTPTFSAAFPTRSGISENAWRDRLANYKGFGYGIPQGKYVVELRNSAGVVLGTVTVKVLACQVTTISLPNLA